MRSSTGAAPAEASLRADLLLTAAIGVAVALQVANLFAAAGPLPAPRVATVVGCQLATAGLQLLHSLRRPRALRDRVWPVTLAGQAGLTVVAVLTAHTWWGGAPTFVLASLLLLRPRWGWALVAVVEVGSILVLRPPVGDAVYLLAANVTAALGIWGLSRLADDVAELRAGRERAARLAVARERERFSRDLHDLLGYSLSAITLTGELAVRLARSDPERARRELAGVPTLAGEAAFDVRAVATGDRTLSLAGQLSAARTVLVSGGMSVHVSGAQLPLPAVVDTVLATVVREAVTNLLRHSSARRCRAELTRADGVVTLVVANDGVGPSGTEPVGERGGLANLQARLTTVGGRLSTRDDGDGWFRVTATVPLEAR